MQFVDIHTHKRISEPDVLMIQNLFPGEKIDQNSNNYYSVGLHPWYIKSNEENKSQLNSIQKISKEKGVIAIGECGMDKKTEIPFFIQEKIFIQQIEISEKEELPVLIHSVRSLNEIIRINKLLKPVMPWIIHGYIGNIRISEQLLKLNIYFSFGKSILQDHPNVLKSLLFIPLDKIFFETDEFERHVKEIYQKAADILKMDHKKLEVLIHQNFKKVFQKAL